MTVSLSWKSRPKDERAYNLNELHTKAKARADHSRAIPVSTDNCAVRTTEDQNNISLTTPVSDLSFSHWSFGQVCSLAKAPSGYLRKLPPALAGVNINFGLRLHRDADTMLSYFDNRNNQLRAITSETYGRIYDYRIVEGVNEIISQFGDRWQIPQAVLQRPRDTTLYTSDRDLFIFLIDTHVRIPVPGQAEPAYRGLFVKNSEVGSCSFEINPFLYNGLCANRTIFGVTELGRFRMRHSAFAPDRFAKEALPYLSDYINSDPNQITKQLEAAAAIKRPEDKDPNDWVRQQLRVTAEQAQRVAEYAEAEQGGMNNLWDLIQGTTAFARSKKHQDARCELETKAGALLAKAA